MHIRKSLLSAIVIALSFLCLFTACKRNNDDTAGNKEVSSSKIQELVVGDRSIALSIDPTGSRDANYLVKIGVGETLFKVDNSGVIQPLLAESIEQVDPKHWTIKLREDVSFASGTVMDASAVIASLERSRELDTKAKSYLKGMTFSKTGDFEISVETKTDNMMVKLNLSNFQLIIHNIEYDYTSAEKTDFTGMYKIDKFVASQAMTLSTNENYWGTKPVIQRVLYEEISDDQTRTVGALSGRYHIMLNIPATSISQFKDSQTATTLSASTDSTQTIYLNLTKPHLSDYRVRQALSWALDREELIVLGAEGQGSPVTTWIGSNPFYSDAAKIFFDKYNLEKASELLNEAGWILADDGLRYKDGKVLRMSLMTWGTEQALGVAIQAQWSALGIDCEVSHVDYNLIMSARETNDWDATIEAWSTYGNPAAMLGAQYAPGASGNYGGFNDSKTNDILDKLSMAASDEERHDLIIQLSEHVAELSPAIYLFPRPSITAINNSLEGFKVHFRQIENVVTSDLRINE